MYITSNTIRQNRKTTCLRGFLIIFDCDGVLVDSEVLAAKAEVRTLKQLGIRLHQTEILQDYTGLSSEQMIKDLEYKYGSMIDMTLYKKLFEKFRSQIFEKNLKATSGLYAVLKSLRSPICVASNSDKSRLYHSLRITNLEKYFGKNIFSSDEVQRPKPAPDLFLYAASQMGFPPNKVFVIEDTETGLKAAKQAGMRTIAYTGGRHHKILSRQGKKLNLRNAEANISHMNELPKLLQTLLSNNKLNA